jgi:hypothetical protein
MIPVVALSGIPLLLVSRANSEEMYSFSFGRTPGDRERFQLEGVLSSRDQAAEVRIFGIESYLVSRWRRLYDERIAELVGLVRRFGRRSLIAAAGVAGTSACSARRSRAAMNGLRPRRPTRSSSSATRSSSRLMCRRMATA